MFSSIETQTRLAELRQKVLSGTELSTDETKEAIRLLRADRLRIPEQKAAGRTKTPAVDVDSLLGELGI